MIFRGATRRIVNTAHEIGEYHTEIKLLAGAEIAHDWGFNSVRSQFVTNPPAPNPDRAVPHNNNGSAFNYTDSSWKVFGGGMEMHAVDLAQFG